MPFRAKQAHETRGGAVGALPFRRAFPAQTRVGWSCTFTAPQLAAGAARRGGGRRARSASAKAPSRPP